MRILAMLCLACLAPFLAACVPTSAMKIHSVPVKSSSGGIPIQGKRGASCRVAFSGITEGRRDKDDLGAVAGREVKADDVVELVSSHLREALARSPGISLSQPGDQTKPDVQIQGRLLLAHVDSFATAMSANIAVRITLTGKAHHQETFLARGQQTDTNWASGDGEIKNLIADALADLNHETMKHLLPSCSHGPVAVGTQ